METGKMLGGKDRVTYFGAMARNHVDDALGQAGFFEQFVEVVSAEQLGTGRLPQDGVTHQCRSGRQVASDGREVERSNGKDKPFEGPILDAVPDARGRDGLVLVDLFHEPDVESEEVDQLTSGIDFGLVRVLALPQHG